MKQSTATQIVESINALTVGELAGMADVYHPSRDSEGAEMLKRVQNGFAEMVEYYAEENTEDEWTADGFREWAEYDGKDHQIADDAPSIYTHTKMKQLVDLCAWDYDISDFGPVEDIQAAAGYALYGVARDLVYALFAHVEEFENVEDDDA